MYELIKSYFSQLEYLTLIEEDNSIILYLKGECGLNLFTEFIFKDEKVEGLLSFTERISFEVKEDTLSKIRDIYEAYIIFNQCKGSIR